MNKRQLPGVLRDIAGGALSRADAAERLACSERTVNREMKKAGIERPASPAHAARAAAAERRVRREHAARAVYDGQLTAEAAAEQAEVHIRTIYRHLDRIKAAEKQPKTAAKPAKTRQKRNK